MGEISTATREQNSGIEQINAALTEMDSVTQQNAALVQQTSSAASALEGQARELADLMATFRIDESAASAVVLTHKGASHQHDGHIEPAPRQQATQSKKEAVDEWDEF